MIAPLVVGSQSDHDPVRELPFAFELVDPVFAPHRRLATPTDDCWQPAVGGKLLDQSRVNVVREGVSDDQNPSPVSRCPVLGCCRLIWPAWSGTCSPVLALGPRHRQWLGFRRGRDRRLSHNWSCRGQRDCCSGNCNPPKPYMHECDGSCAWRYSPMNGTGDACTVRIVTATPLPAGQLTDRRRGDPCPKSAPYGRN